ncbi:MAG: zinc-dependent metalloprotease [Bacteroidales bacterium]
MKFKIVFCAALLSFGATTASAKGILFWKKKKTTAADSVSVKSDYDKFTGSDVKTSAGVFKIHQKKNDYYFEIPADLLGRDFLIVNKLQKVQAQLNEAGVNKAVNYENNLIRFEIDKAQQKLMVRQVMPAPDAPQEDAISRSVRENFISPLIASFKIEAQSKDSSSFVIKVNDIYTGAEKSINNVFDNIGLGTSAIKDLSRIVSAKAFTDNIVVTSEQTTKVSEGNTSIHVTVEVSSSMILLPETPMAARFDTKKVGYFGTPYAYFNDRQQKTEARKLITRWRLEPREEDREKYLRGELVEPAKPIVFYIDQSTPYQWREYMRRGVEDWQVAFEKAGFKNAIVARQLNDSIEASADDINYSVINYIASDKVNAMGPSIIDPRSGEILEADIIWWHNVLSMIQKWITVQTGMVDPGARQLVIPDSIMGDAMRFVACHEVGHSLGLRHNMMGSWAYPTDSLRSKAFTDRVNSTSSSIMDYARYNYIAQPGDGVTKLAPNIGPYDIFAIEYGYRWFGKTSPREENAELKTLLQQHTSRDYVFGDAQDPRDAIDPRAQNEDLGDDPVKSSNYGIANLKRIMPNLIAWSTTTEESKESYFEAGRLLMAVINQWNNYLYHVLAQVGGIYMEDTTPGDGIASYTHVDKAKQKESLQFLLDNVLSDQKWLFGSEINKYTFPIQNSPSGMFENSPSVFQKNAQAYIYWDLLSNNRLVRMLENEAENGKSAFTVVEMLDAMHKHIFGKTERGATLNVKDRELEKGFVDALILAVSEDATNKNAKKLMEDSHFLFDSETAQEQHICSRCAHGDRSASKTVNFYGTQSNRLSDAISVKRGELLRIADLLKTKQHTSDIASRYHYKDLILRINTALGL